MKKKTLRASLIIISVLILAGGAVAYKMYNKPHRNVQKETAVKVMADSLVAAYEIDEPAANTVYLNKTVEVSGEVNDISTDQEGKKVVSLKTAGMGTVRCTLEDKNASAPAIGTSVKIKGICTGYLMDVIITRAVII